MKLSKKDLRDIQINKINHMHGSPFSVLLEKEIKQKSAPVTDIENQVEPVRKIMAELCRQKRGNKIGVALAHCQFSSIDPLTFYVLANGEAIVNPRIILVKEKSLMWHKEGCLSFPNKSDIEVLRYRMIKAEYTLVNDLGTRQMTKTLSDMSAFVMQHEIDHFNLKYIYPEFNRKQ
jgi:peptide deformylase